LGDPIEKDEIGGACSTYGVESRGVYRVLVGKSEKGDHLEDPDLGGRIMVR